MKNIWATEELIEKFTLLPEELRMVLSKSKESRLKQVRQQSLLTRSTGAD